MARKKKKRQGSHEAEPSGAFVPASLENSRDFRSKSLSFDEPAPAAGTAGSFAQYSRSTADYSNRRKQGMSRGSKVALAIVIVALVAAVAALGFYVFKEMQKQAINDDLHSMSRDIMEAIDNELTGMTTFEEPFTVLLLGSDERTDPDEKDIGARTDTIVLCRIDPTQNIISMVSIPRDTKVTIEGVGDTKINAAYAYGGPSATISAVKELCGVEIDHYAEINFDGLVGLVDAIGGIDVYNDEVIDDPDAGWLTIEEGDVHLDGQGALVFARSRAYADGDFTRVSNQRKIIEAIVHKGLEAPSSELYGLIQASTEFLTTDTSMDVDFIFSLADQIRHNNDYPVRLYSATIPASTDMIGGVSYVIANQAGVADMIEVFLEGGDVSTVATTSSEASSADELSEVGSTSSGSGYGYGYGYSDSSSTGYDSGYGTGYGTGGSGYGTGTGYGTSSGYGDSTGYSTYG